MSDLASLKTRMTAANEKGGRTMWMLAFADAAFALLARPEKSFTTDELLAVLMARRDGLDDGSPLRDAYDQAVTEVLERAV